jgi:innexin
MFDYGPAGHELQKLHALCLLPLNNVNEKIFVFLWCWFLVLVCVTGLAFVYRLITIFSSRCRAFLLKRSAYIICKKDVDNLTNKCHYGDWFILRRIGQNMDKFVFNEFIRKLSDDISTPPDPLNEIPV